LLRINATGATLNGMINLNGTQGNLSGGGAGGGLWIQAGNLFGDGTLDAAGGPGSGTSGGGGGGIILLAVHNGYYFTGSVSVSGGAGMLGAGGNGFFTQEGF
jgi:hypothetical protein